MEIKEYIIKEADKLFCQFGFKSVTMDDIAKHLGMSKKTIYQHFSDKDELVNILISEKIGTQDCVVKDGAKNSENAVHEIFFAMSNINELLSNMNPKLFYDLQKYHPKAWLIFRRFKEKTLTMAIANNLERGVEEGLYRSEINVDIITQMRLAQIDLLFNQHDNYTMNKYSLAQVMIAITEHYLFGVCSPKGLELISRYQQKKPTQA
ncbi:helix-turn-helix domain-containing protein [Pedobacter sp. KR3-3]|uniref:Helix-turn-helix domain-containing protein n=1 Tax=Pedobacter albus TaxID=3113905 RepID=A0ABU7I8R0_9SPHI|nr:helix-turn-helix domain-containing protein [Pedobacter sp. KR3-3]MEE1945856.1 helix-turn-helix domain-containing protein [Pedobacter sp. KR3-3]